MTFRRAGVHASLVMAGARARGAQVIALIHVYKYTSITLFDPISIHIHSVYSYECMDVGFTLRCVASRLFVSERRSLDSRGDFAVLTYLHKRVLCTYIAWTFFVAFWWYFFYVREWIFVLLALWLFCVLLRTWVLKLIINKLNVILVLAWKYYA